MFNFMLGEMLNASPYTAECVCSKVGLPVLARRELIAIQSFEASNGGFDKALG